MTSDPKPAHTCLGSNRTFIFYSKDREIKPLKSDLQHQQKTYRYITLESIVVQIFLRLSGNLVF